MILVPKDTPDFQAIVDIREACGDDASGVLEHVARGESVVYALIGEDVRGTVVLAIDGKDMLIEAVAGREKSGRLTARLLPLVKQMARAHGCARVRAHATKRAAGRLYRRLSDRQECRGADTVSWAGVC